MIWWIAKPYLDLAGSICGGGVAIESASYIPPISRFCNCVHLGCGCVNQLNRFVHDDADTGKWRVSLHKRKKSFFGTQNNYVFSCCPYIDRTITTNHRVVLCHSSDVKKKKRNPFMLIDKRQRSKKKASIKDELVHYSCV